MKKISRRRNKSLFFLTFILVLVACSKESELLVNEKYSKGDDNSPPLSERFTLDKSKLAKIGESVSVKRPTMTDNQNIGFELIVNNATIYDNPAEAGIQQEELREVQIYDNEEQPEMVKVEDIVNGSILICELTLTNINEEDEPNIAFLSLVVEDDKQNLRLLTYPTYFASSVSEGEMDTKFFHFNLLKGQSIITKVGWPIDLKTLRQEQLYLVANFRGDDELMSYIDLQLSEGREAK
ncbi:DUF5027 family lipoprotein [uncultured Vagococcus sp.]|uniref:DUF5027 family lipoprotein n=1 Tax=uncultured Vagococcus sp. TaxID=189676 RepID=UPI0028D5922E|nr:DUF5027 family lipoprotein [uncultured Vagococcus sp.]